MKKMKNIGIDLELDKYIQNNRLRFDEPYNNILKRLLGLDDNYENSKYREVGIPEFSGGFHWKDVFFPNGMKLRKTLKGELYEAEVLDGKIICNDKEFKSPSAAGKSISKTQVNGWAFWEYLDKVDGVWKLLDELRQNKKPA